MARPRKSGNCGRRLPIVLDFDKTCIGGDMTDALLQLRRVNPTTFWTSVHVLTMSGLDFSTAYTRQFTESLVDETDGLTHGDLVRVGQGLELVTGLTDALSDARAAAITAGVDLAVIVITCGLKEVVEASPLAAHVDACFGSTFHTDSGGRLICPDEIVTADAKAEILSLISANGVPSMGIPPAPVADFIYIGDGFSDRAAFEFIRQGGGRALLVHQGDLDRDDHLTGMIRSIGLQTANLDYRRSAAAYTVIMDHIAEIANDRSGVDVMETSSGATPQRRRDVLRPSPEGRMATATSAVPPSDLNVENYD